MRYHTITGCDLLNGEGIRVVLWVSHCEHKCTGCHNPQTWSAKSGEVFGEEAKKELFECLSKPYITGLTLSGGDPLSTLNRNEIAELIKEVKEKFPHQDIWAYTGYTFDEVKNLEAMKYIDVLVDGKFEEALSIPSPQWRGSNNQNIIDVKRSIGSDVLCLK